MSRISYPIINDLANLKFNNGEMELVELNTGQIMPYIGLGTSIYPHGYIFRLPLKQAWNALHQNTEEMDPIIDNALEMGYRHFDTAPLYSTELHVGNATKKWIDCGKLKRKDLFLTTKLPQIGMTPEKVSHFLDKSLKDLQTDYVDLYLIHWPIGLEYIDDVTMFPKDENGDLKLDMTTDVVAVWKAMEKEVNAGRCKAIGVCNFNETQLQRIMDIAEYHPSVNQVEVHIYFQQEELRGFCARNNIWVTAYHPLGGRDRENYPKEWSTKYPLLLEDETVIEVAKKYDRTPAQLLLRFLIQMGVAAVPKTKDLAHLKENYSVTTFNIKMDDMKILRTLDKSVEGRSCFCFSGSEKHPEYPF